MAMGIDDFLLSVVTGLIGNAITAPIDNSVTSVFQRRKIKRRVDNAVDEVIEPILDFLQQEKITEHQQYLLVEACRDDLTELANNPEKLFQGSLDGQKIFDNLYSGEGKKLPETIRDEKLEGVYSLLFPRIATVVCKIPAAVKDWENEAWTENYRRLDELAEDLRKLFEQVDALVKNSDYQADETLELVRRTLAQKIGLKLDITGLRSESPLSGKFDNFFIHPELIEITTKVDEREQIKIQFPGRELTSIRTSDESFKHFTKNKIKVIIEGAPGSGKSTWSKWLQKEIVNNKVFTGIGIRVELRSFSNLTDLPYVQTLIRETVNPNIAEEITSKKIRNWLDKQKIVFILDGFDEISPQDRERVKEWVLELESAINKCSIIITSRPLTTNHLEDLKNQDWKQWNIQSFDEPRIIDYINRWYQYSELLQDSDRSINAADIAEKWRNDPTIEPLTGNPLLLSTLLMVNHLDGSLPSGRSELYKRYVKGMLGLWDDRRKVQAAPIKLTLQQKEQLLRGIALDLHLKEKEQLDEAEMIELVEKWLNKLKFNFAVKDVLQVLRERTGLIIGPGIYSFVHKSVGEYFVADTVFQGNQKDESGETIDRLYLLKHQRDDRWKVVIFLWAGIASVGNLVSFIDACKLANNYSLAYGLLYDQYDKISSEDRRRLLLELLFNDQVTHNNVIEFFPDLMVQFSYNYSVPNLIYFEDDLNFYDILIYNISGDIRITDLYLQALNIQDLAVTDIAENQGYIRDLVWTEEIIFNSTNFERWKSCLNLIDFIPGNLYKEIFIIYLIIQSLANAYHFNPSLIEPVINGLNHISTEVKKITALYLIDVIFNRSMYEIEKNNCKQFLLVLSKQNYQDINSVWLQGTHQWQSPFKTETVDLLTTFIEKLEKLNNQGLIEKDENYEGSMNFMQKLIERREQEKEQYPLEQLKHEDFFLFEDDFLS